MDGGTDANREQHMMDVPFPCYDTIAQMNANGGWRGSDLPEPTRTAPRPDTATAGSRGGD